MTPTTKTSATNYLFETVINGGYCVGCGACASVKDSPMQMELDPYGRFTATASGHPKEGSSASVAKVCPFSDQALNEDQLSSQLFADTCQYHDQIGYHLTTYAGHVAEGTFRERGSSGGMGSWLVSKLLSEGLVDGVIHVQQRHPTATDSRLFEYQVSTTIEQVQRGAKSRYYPIELSQVMQLVRERPGRYVIVGIPCFIKAVRLLMQQDSLLAERIVFCVGLICGHLKSIHFAEMFAWQCGIEPGKLLAIDFRKKLLERGANDYGIEVTGIRDGEVITETRAVRELFGSDWGLGFFKYKACDYCDDVAAETADVVVGDAWLPQYVSDSQGTNVLIVRHPVIQTLIEQALAKAELNLDQIDADEVAKSQVSGFSHRREGLAYRLHLADSQGVWHPPKRVKPQSVRLHPNFRQRHVMRMKLAAESHLAFHEARQSGNFAIFVSRMELLIQKHYALY
jgi:coenzyme F420-reducing hydrogenase beta subunit